MADYFAKTSTTARPTPKPDLFANDDFMDVRQAMVRVNQQQEPWRSLLSKMTLRRSLGHKVFSIAELRGVNVPDNATVYDKFQFGITNVELYSENDSNVDQMLQQIATSPFESIEQKDGGTQFKLVVDLEDGGQALFKPKRFDRSQVRYKTAVKVMDSS